MVLKGGLQFLKIIVSVPMTDVGQPYGIEATSRAGGCWAGNQCRLRRDCGRSEGSSIVLGSDFIGTNQFNTNASDQNRERWHCLLIEIFDSYKCKP